MKLGAEMTAILIVADGLTRHEIAARTGIPSVKVSKLIYSAIKTHGYIERSDPRADQYDYKGHFNLTKAGREKLAALASGADSVRGSSFNKLVDTLKTLEDAPVIIPKKGGYQRKRTGPYKKKKEYEKPEPQQQNLKLDSMSDRQKQALAALQDSFAESSNSHQAILEIYEICKKYLGGE